VAAATSKALGTGGTRSARGNLESSAPATSVRPGGAAVELAGSVLAVLAIDRG
jgi:hypothetical protein